METEGLSYYCLGEVLFEDTKYIEYDYEASLGLTMMTAAIDYTVTVDRFEFERDLQNFLES
jgi:hypothetical protein